MSDGIKDLVLNKAVDELLNLIIGKEKKDIINYLTKDDLKKILKKEMIKFSESDTFKNEFVNVRYVQDSDIIKKIDIKDINPSNSIEILREKIRPVVDVCFVSDYSDDKDIILSYIVKNYRNSASLKVNLKDLLIKQEEIYKNTENKLKEHTDMLEKIIEQTNEEKRKKDMMKNQLFDELLGVLNDISNRYTYYVMKDSYTYKNDDPDEERRKAMIKFQMKEGVKDVLSKLDIYVKEDFFKIPVKCQIYNDKISIIKPVSTVIDYSIYCTNMFKKPSIEKIDKVISSYSNYLTNNFSKGLLELKKSLNNFLFYTRIDTPIINDIGNANFDVKDLRNAIKSVGDSLIYLYNELE